MSREHRMNVTHLVMECFHIDSEYAREHKMPSDAGVIYLGLVRGPRTYAVARMRMELTIQTMVLVLIDLFDVQSRIPERTSS